MYTLLYKVFFCILLFIANSNLSFADDNNIGKKSTISRPGISLPEDVAKELDMLEGDLREIVEEIKGTEKAMEQAGQMTAKYKRQANDFLNVVKTHIDALASCRILEGKYNNLNGNKGTLTKLQNEELEKCVKRAEKDVNAFDAAEVFLLTLEKTAKELKLRAETKAASAEALDKSRRSIEAKIGYWRNAMSN